MAPKAVGFPSKNNLFHGLHCMGEAPYLVQLPTAWQQDAYLATLQADERGKT